MDLTLNINEKAQQWVNRELVNELVNGQTNSNGSLTNSIKIIENKILDDNAEANKTIIIERKDVLRARSLSMKQMDGLEQQVVNRDGSGIRWCNWAGFIAAEHDR